MRTATYRLSGAAIVTMAFGMALSFTTPVAAAETAPAPPGTVESGNVPEQVEEPPPVNRGNVTLTLGADITSAYFFRGILQERDGFIFQPYANVNFTLFKGEEGAFFNTVGFSVGDWSSVQTEKTGASGSGPTNWYESDISLGPSVGFGNYFTTSLIYIAYTYPNGSFPTVQELDWSFAFNDKDFLGAFSLQPAMTWAFELDNTAFGDQEGVYLQLGVKPSYVFFEDASYPFTLALPLTLGLSVSDYYEVPGVSNDTFGYFDGGLVGSVPLAFLPEEYGAWSFSAGVDVLALSGTLADANRGNGTQWIGKGGVVMTY